MSDTITVTGNITQPELRHTNAGVPVVHFRIGSTERVFRRDEGKWADGATNWFSVSAFRGFAEHVFQSLHHGDRVIVTGRLRLKKWETAAGSGFTAEIDADSIGHDLRWGTTTFHDGRRDTEEQKVAGDGSWPVAPVGVTAASDGPDAWTPPLTAATATLDGSTDEREQHEERQPVGVGAESLTPF